MVFSAAVHIFYFAIVFSYPLLVIFIPVLSSAVAVLFQLFQFFPVLSSVVWKTYTPGLDYIRCVSKRPRSELLTGRRIAFCLLQNKCNCNLFKWIYLPLSALWIKAVKHQRDKLALSPKHLKCELFLPHTWGMIQKKTKNHSIFNWTECIKMYSLLFNNSGPDINMLISAVQSILNCKSIL